jgi:hypothetical protein
MAIRAEAVLPYCQEKHFNVILDLQYRLNMLAFDIPLKPGLLKHQKTDPSLEKNRTDRCKKPVPFFTVYNKLGFMHL